LSFIILVFLRTKNGLMPVLKDFHCWNIFGARLF
jgi:hypothetical protein